MKIEIGKYYLNEDGELVYVFASGGMEVTGSLTYPDGVDEKDVIGMLSIKVLPFITKKDYLQFQQSVSEITVYKESGEATYPELKYVGSGLSWQEVEPSEGIRTRFEKSYKFMNIIKLFIDHMYDTYSDKYKEEDICVRDILK